MAVADLLNSHVTASVGPNKQFAGTVLFVGDDFIVLEEDSQETVVLSTPHLKFCCASSTETASQRKRRSQSDWERWRSKSEAGDLKEVMCTLKHTVVQLGGGGLDSTNGYLVDVMDDYVILVVVPEGTVYLPIQHIQTVIPIHAAIRPEFMTWVDASLSGPQGASRFVEALVAEIGTGIKLGRGGPEDISGILRAADEAFVEIVVSPHEVAYIPTHHVKAFTRLVPSEWKAPREAPIT